MQFFFFFKPQFFFYTSQPVPTSRSSQLGLALWVHLAAQSAFTRHKTGAYTSSKTDAYISGKTGAHISSKTGVDASVKTRVFFYSKTAVRRSPVALGLFLVSARGSKQALRPEKDVQRQFPNGFPNIYIGNP